MEPLAEKLFHLFELAPQALGYGFSLDCVPLALIGRRTDMCKPQKIESLGLTHAAFPPVLSGKPAKFDEPCLLRV